MEENNDNKKSSFTIGPSDIINGLTSLGNLFGIGEGKRNRQQVEQQKKLNDVNASTSKELAAYEQQLKLQMWHDTNYGAQLAEAEKAGVSKAAVLGGGGTGTGQGASVSGVSGGGAPSATDIQNAKTNQMMAAAQIALTAAQARKTEAETKKIEGVDTQKTKGEISQIAQGIKNAEAQEMILKVDGRIKKATEGYTIEEIMWNSNKAVSEYEKAVSEAYVAENTQQQIIQQMKIKTSTALLEKQLQEANIKKTKTEIQKIATDIAVGKAQVEFQGTDKVLGKYIEKTTQYIQDIFKRK